MTSSKNILSSDVEIKGKLRFSNDLIIDGRIEGEVNSEGDLTVGENAQIVGDIKTRSVVVFGKVQGNISVTDRCELKQNAELHGDVVASKLAIEEGAAFMGASTVGSPGKPASSSKPVSSPAPSSGGDSSGDGGGGQK
ncbi:MAG: polymer-forming cytoskeletal protein [Verrucomicrobiota bacterium]